MIWSPERLSGAVPFADDYALDKVWFKLAHHGAGPFAAVADQAYAPAREPLDGRDTDVFGEAFGDYLAFTQVHEQRASHFFSALQPAAIASRAFE